ncbi:hypothetical protein [Undibacterium sp. Ji22W]|uniref:hypothetical protein n=1 Tax=Undibacterium sp. Ji22W TaxID=3413038 RepID=UPI003BF36035
MLKKTKHLILLNKPRLSDQETNTHHRSRLDDTERLCTGDQRKRRHRFAITDEIPL